MERKKLRVKKEYGAWYYTKEVTGDIDDGGSQWYYNLYDEQGNFVFGSTSYAEIVYKAENQDYMG